MAKHNEPKAVKLLRQLRRVAPDAYQTYDFPEPPHTGPCGPESGCDMSCVSIANMSEYNGVLHRVDEYLRYLSSSAKRMKHRAEPEEELTLP